MKKVLIIIYTSILIVSLTIALDLKINIISRSKRWANETLKYADRIEYQKLTEQQKKYIENLKKHYQQYQEYLKKQHINYLRNQYLQQNWLSEITIDKVIEYENWKKLWWPFQYHYKKDRIVIHHTANDYKKFKNPEEIKKFLRWIYHYHAITKGWWDLWYHYIIDPWGNIYEWRAWWKGVVGAHAIWNNTPSIGIALIWNFEKQKPTKKQLISLIKLILYLSSKYNIDLEKQVYWHKPISSPPYIKDIKLSNIVGHKDVWYTACPGNNLYTILPKIKKIAIKLQEKIKNNDSTIRLTSQSIKYSKKTQNNKKNQYTELLNRLKENYLKTHKVYLAKYKTKKIKEKIYLSEAKDFLNKNISVLLYQLSTEFNNRNVTCENKCIVTIDTKKNLETKNISITKKWSILNINLNNNNFNTSYIVIKDSKNGLVIFTNYNRKSFAWIPWNSFKGSIIIKKDIFKTVKKQQKKDFIVINKLNFKDYLLWIAESNDNQPLEKSKALAVIAKTYAIFYIKNQHPNIPYGASYNAVDDPRIFQKYVWAGFEKTSKTWPTAVDQTWDWIVTYKNYIPILPYFNCSAGFTFSAEEKFWWIDTPYLKSKLDLYKCDTFKWHWVGLSWKWAEILAKKWVKWQQILRYYYDWIDLTKISN